MYVEWYVGILIIDPNTSSNDFDISWLTQTPSQNNEDINIVECSSDKEIDVVGIVPSLKASKNVCVALDKGSSMENSSGTKSHILYDNVMIANISSDQDINQL